MKDLILIGFFCASLFCYPQSEEDQVIDSILDELFETEASPVDFSQSHFLYTSFSFDESVFFAGRNFGIDQFGFTPSISYMKGKNFFVSLGAAYFSELDPQWDFVSLSSGYSLFLNKEEQLSLTALYSRIFFSTETEDLNPNRFSVALSLQKNSWGARLSGGYLFGGSASFYTAAATHFVIPIKKIKNAEMNLRPQLSVLMSEQTVSEQISGGILNNTTLERDVFDLINTQLSLPLLIDVGSWDFELSYNINFPKGLPSESDLSTNGYLSLSVGYFTGL